MPQAKVYNLEGAEVGVIDLDDRIFSETAKPELFYQVVRVLQARRRMIVAHTKDRSQVRGGGKKPWAQKGTGRARHGSIRSPLWKGGGVTFGPTAERNYYLDIPRKMIKKALRSALAAKVADNAFWVVRDFNLDKPTTKKFAAFLKKLGLEKKKVLFVTDKNITNAILSARNLPAVTPVRLENFNLLDLLKHSQILLSQDIVAKLTKQIAK